MKLSEVKKIIRLANELNICKRELFDNINNEESNFDVENYTFIEECGVFNIVKNMYESDTYILGCFNAWFIADNCNIPYNCVEALQKAEAFSELGELMLENGIDELIEEYIRLDGAGHALNSYDGSNEEITINEVDYIYYRTN